MKVQFKNLLYIVNWKHDRNVDYKKFTSQKVIQTCGGQTICTIYIGKKDDPNRTLVFKESAFCHYKDNYCKAERRKVSLQKVLYNCQVRDFRKAVWEAYRKECKF